MPDSSATCDVVVIGGGIAGLAAALRLQDRGLKPLVLEADSRIGGRMTTDRVQGFSIDRGVTLLGNRFHRMLNLTRRLGLGGGIRRTPFTFGLQDHDGLRRYRACHPEDILFDRHTSYGAKLAFLRMGLDMLRWYRIMDHGNSARSAPIDTCNAREYLAGMGPGGEELLTSILEPGLKGPVGGDAEMISRAILLQTVWNMLAVGTWNIPDGVDLIPEAIAAQVPVQTGSRVHSVRVLRQGVEVEVETGDSIRPIRARGAILAVPGHLAPGLCPDLPPWIAAPLLKTQYSRIASVHVALRRPPELACGGFSFARGLMEGVEIEMEHLRAPARCPQGHGLVSVYLWDTPPLRRLHESDATLQDQATGIVEQTFPDVKGETLFAHVIRWNTGIGLFPPGRLTAMAEIRQKLSHWDAPLDLCGDYLDGLASEGALRTGEQAADRRRRKLQR